VVGTGAAYALWFRGFDRLTASRVSLLRLLSPLVAVVSGLALAAEHSGVAQIVGTVLVLSAVLLGQRAPRDKPVASERRRRTVAPVPCEQPAG
jgi:probable blue pigment (indigoidine) exporter